MSKLPMKGTPTEKGENSQSCEEKPRNKVVKKLSNILRVVLFTVLVSDNRFKDH